MHLVRVANLREITMHEKGCVIRTDVNALELC